MNRNEFKKFIKTLPKEDLVNIILDLTKRKTDVQQNIYYEYSEDEENIAEIIDEIKVNIQNVVYQVFNKRFMFIDNSAVSKYAKLVRKIINDQIEILIRKGYYCEAFELVTKIYFEAYRDLDFSLYKYSSGNSLLKKIFTTWEKIFKKADEFDKIHIFEMVQKDVEDDNASLFFAPDYSLADFYSKYFNSENWNRIREIRYLDEVSKLEREYGSVELIPEENGIMIKNLLDAKIDNGIGENEKKEFLKKYRSIQEINSFEISELIESRKYKAALKLIDEIDSNSDLGVKNKRSNILFRIDIYRLQKDKEKLKSTLYEFLRDYKQSEPFALFEYLSLVDNDDRLKEYENLKKLETVSHFYLEEDFEELFKIEDGILRGDYSIAQKYNNEFVDLLIRVIPHEIWSYYVEEGEEVLKRSASDANYKEAMEYFVEAKKITQYDSELKKRIRALIKEYKRRSKLRDYFKRYELI